MSRKKSIDMDDLDEAALSVDALDAEEFLATSLSEDDVSRLMGIRYEMNTQLKWGEILKECFPSMMKTMENILFQESELSKDRPFDSLFKKEQEFLNGEGDSRAAKTRRNFVVLHFLKKLLGALKTQTNHELAAIKLLTPLDEEEIRRTLAEVERLPLDHRPPRTSPQLRLSKFEDRSVSSVSVEKPEFPGEVIVVANLRRSKEGCSHPSKRIHYDGPEKLTYCRLCHTYIDKESAEPVEEKKVENCTHPQALWVDGMEGKVARCQVPGCGEIVNNPHIYKWSQVGLEPYQDDPSKDEVIVLNQEMQA